MFLLYHPVAAFCPALTCDLLLGVDATEPNLFVIVYPPTEVLLEHGWFSVFYHALDLKWPRINQGQPSLAMDVNLAALLMS